MSATGANLGQAGLERFNRLAHARFGRFLDFRKTHYYSFNSNVYQCTFVFARHGALQSARLIDGEHLDGQLLVAAQRKGRGIHDFQSAHRSEEHTSELQSLMRISYAVFCLKKKKKKHRIYSIA